MTEINQKNREIFMKFCKETWDFDDESMAYVEHRTSDEWEPVPELKSLIKEGMSFEDQRLRFDVDLSDKNIQDLFCKEDKAFNEFKRVFEKALYYLKEKYDCEISYSDFLSNKVVFKKNVTKIKKVLETVYEAFPKAFEYDFDCSYTKERCAEKIVKANESIGANKKGMKKYQLVISFNVVDWFLASTGGKISSCFNLDNSSGGYSFCLGLPFLCGDKNRMMIYFCDGEQKEWMGLKVDSPSTRTWCLLDKSNALNIVKWYPNDTVGVSPVNSITGISRFKNSDSFEEGKYPIDVLSTKKGMVSSVYNDVGKWIVRDDKLIHIGGETRTGQQLFTKNLIDCSENSNSTVRWRKPASNYVDFEYHIPLWVEYGISADSVVQTYKCGCCGENKHGFFMNNNSRKYYCYSCFKTETFVCPICGETHLKKEGTYKVDTTDGKIIEVCESCYSNIDEHICSCCGKFSMKRLRENKNGERICNTCIEERKYGKCSNCGDITKNITIYYNTYTHESTELCDDCCNSDYTSRVFSYKKPHRIISRRLSDVRVTE